MSVQQTEELTEAVTIIAHAACPFVEKETSLDTAASVTLQMSEHSPLYHLSRASAQGHRYHRFVMGGFKVQRSVCVCVCVCVCVL